MAATPQLSVACVLERYYSFAIEATLEAAGFDEDNVAFINPVDPSDNTVASTLSLADRAWAAQHIEAWRRCEVAETPMLIFHSDCAFASSSVFDQAKAMVASAAALAPGVLYLGAAASDGESEGAAALAPAVAAGAHTLLPAQSATRAAAYVVWPTEARLLLKSLPLDAPVLDFLHTHVTGQKMVASPALAIAT